MTLQRGDRPRATMLFGVAAICLIVVGGRLVPSALEWLRSTQAASREVLEARVAADRELGLLPVARDSLEMRSARLARESSTLLPGKDIAGAVSELISQLHDLADESAVHVAAIEGSADSLKKGPYVAIMARAELLGDVHGIAAVLSGIESSELRVRVLELAISQSDPQAPPEKVEVLRMSLAVEGLAPRLAGVERPSGSQTSNGGAQDD